MFEEATRIDTIISGVHYISEDVFMDKYSESKDLYDGYVIGRGRVRIDRSTSQSSNLYSPASEVRIIPRGDVHYEIVSQMRLDASPDQIKASLKPLFKNGEAEISVKSGMTLSHIAALFGVTVKDLVRWNNIENPDNILVGQKIKIKDGVAIKSTANNNPSVEAIYAQLVIDQSVDPATVNRNLFGSVYIGPLNPRTKDGKSWSYQPKPQNRVDAAAMWHDKYYDNVQIEGFSGLLTDTRAIGGDWKFVFETHWVYVTDLSPKVKGIAALSSFGLGLVAIPKTFYQLYIKRGGIINPIGSYYNIKEILDDYKKYSAGITIPPY